MNPNKWIILLVCILWNSSVVAPLSVSSSFPPKNIILAQDHFDFNRTRAYEIIQKQVDIGPRYPGSDGIEKTRLLIASELLPDHEWVISYQNFSKIWMENQNISLVNIICRPIDLDSTQPFFILCAHYDTRLWADKDPDSQKRKQPVLGANDGASGVAMVLELGRIMLEYYNVTNFKLVFFDGEDQGNIYGWDWILGSRFFVNSEEFLNQDISFAILLDMVAGKNATFKREKNSDIYAADLVTKIWNEASALGYNNYFLNQSGRGIIDDHIPILEKGVPAIDIIDEFGTRYKPWHTTFDNMTFIDERTLQAVGWTLESVLFRFSTSNEWFSSLTSFTFQTQLILFDWMSGTLLLILGILNRKRKISRI